MGNKVKVTNFLIVLVLSFVLGACSNDAQTLKGVDTGLSKNEIRNEAFKDLFPAQYASYQENSEQQNTKYGGSNNWSKFTADREPMLPVIFNGFPFATEYNKARGHVYALEDITHTLRVSDKTPGSCMTCKSTAVPQLIEKMGDHYWSGSFKQEIYPAAEKLGHSPIGCSDCHNPKTMELRVTRQMFAKAMSERGIDVSKATKNEMRSYVCAQCHVTYYLNSTTKEVTLPWKNGFKPDEMYAYYENESKNNGFKSDYISNISGTPMLKARHPEFEMASEGTHAKAGVACADCHMPYQKEKGKKISSHHWTSPLNTIESSCRTCHADKKTSELKKRVTEIQDMHVSQLLITEKTLAKAHYYVNKMITSSVTTSKIKEAQEHVRKGQWFEDFVAAENSSGFHNPQGSMSSLKTAMDEANLAIQIATEELVKKGVSMGGLNTEIEKVYKEIDNEKDTSKKKDHATNSYFPPQAPVVATPTKK